MWLDILRMRWFGQGRSRASARARANPSRQRLRFRPCLEVLEDRTLLTAAWMPIGPAPILTNNNDIPGNGPVSGRVTGIAADPHNADTVYIATAGGGIWKTTDATAASPTWTPLTDRLTDKIRNPLPIFMGAIAETDATSGTYSGNQIVYAGTGEANGVSYSYGNGILVSKDGGSTWTLTQGPNDAFSGEAVSKIVIDYSADSTGATAFAAVSYNPAANGIPTYGSTGHTGIWETTDFGQTWKNVTHLFGLSNTDSWSDVAIDPHTPSTLYAADSTSGSTDYGIWKSADGGVTWTLLTPGLSGSSDQRIALALYDDGTTNELIASVATSSGDVLMLKSTDGGNTFTKLIVTDYLGDQGNYDNTVAIDPLDPNYIYAGGSNKPDDAGIHAVGNVESFDGGNSWYIISQDHSGNGPHQDEHAAVFDANDNLLDGSDGGVFRLTVGPTPTAAEYQTQTWSDLTGNLQITQFYGIAVDPTNGAVYGGSQDNGVEKYTGALGWDVIEWGDGGIIRVDPTNHNVVYTELNVISLDVSFNGGTSLTSITSGIKVQRKGDRIAPYVLDSSGDIYYGTDYLNFSSNHGTSWTQIGTPGTPDFNPNDAPIDAIAVSPTDNNVVYVSAGGKIFVTQNAQAGGSNVTWSQFDLPNNASTNGLGDFGQDALAVDPSDSSGGTAYAVVPGSSSGSGRVFMTTNFGETWTDITGNLPNTHVNAVTVSPNGKTVFIGTDVGVYSTSTGGETWTRFGTGLPNAKVTDLEYVPSLHLLAAGTYGRGVWEIPTAPLAIMLDPTNQAVNVGQTATFTAVAASATASAPTVQWQVSTDDGNTWSSISGATSSTLTFSDVQSSQNGNEYRAVFTNSAGSAATAAAILGVATGSTTLDAATVPQLMGDIIVANADSSTANPMVIQLTSSTYDLTRYNNVANGRNGLPYITAQDLTIEGTASNNSSAATIERTRKLAFRLFDVAGSASLTLRDLTLQGGLALGTGAASEGGAVYSSGALKLSSVAVIDNKAVGSQGADAFGGGLYVAAGKATLLDDQIHSNVAQGGKGTNGVYGSTAAGQGGNAYGGGLDVAAGVVTLENDTISSNRAQGGNGGAGGNGLVPTAGGQGGNASGGGLYVAAGTVSLTGDQVAKNRAVGGAGGAGGNGFFGAAGGQGGSADGGGLDVAGGAVALTDDTITGNVARGGAGGAGGLGTNPAQDGAGGNGGDAYGGGLYYLVGAVTINNDTIEKNRVIGGTGGSGDPSGSVGSARGANTYEATSV
ncbi:MAG: hypothetical protein ACYC3I_21280 [Gemmataceae bacterium]